MDQIHPVLEDRESEEALPTPSRKLNNRVLLVYLILSCSNLEQAFSILLISFPLIGDAFFTLLKRFLSKHNIFKPHKLHLYQRLNQGGLSHGKISIIYIFSTLYLVISYLIFGINFLFLSTLILIILAIKIDKKFAIPFKSNI